MQKWEYQMKSIRIARSRDEPDKEGRSKTHFYSGNAVWMNKDSEGKSEYDYISEWGLEGWELVNVVPIAMHGYLHWSSPTEELLFTFKRPIVESEE